MRRRPTFDEALDAAHQGVPWALGWLYRRFQPGLLRMLEVIAPHQAENLASDVWLGVAGTLPKFEGDEPAFRTWLATPARRRVIQASRAHGPRAGRSVEDDEQDAAASFAAQVVAVLSPDQADVVLLRMWRGSTSRGWPGPSASNLAPSGLCSSRLCADWPVSSSRARSPPNRPKSLSFPTRSCLNKP